MPAAKQVAIRILPLRAVVIDDRLRVAGDEATVSEADARTLVADRFAEPVEAKRERSEK
jgi:hypothetical protein